MAFWRFSSDQVASFNKLQVDLIRTHSPGRDVMHNYMGNFTEFDHYQTGKDLDIAAWDNYPLGFLDRDSANIEDRQKWFRTGHPDSSAFHHDLYRGVGRLWVIEQQPGPVNWAPHNPAPLPGMVRLWALEALAHGAEVMSWFRWRQAPFAQEQMHTGLLLPDGTEDEAAIEAREVFKDIQSLLDADKLNESPKPLVAIVFDYPGDQMLRIQPQGQNYDPLGWVQQIYTSVRRCGVNVDIVSPHQPLTDYKMVVLVNSVSICDELHQQLSTFDGHVVIGPRCGSKTEEYSIPPTLPPGVLQSLMPIKVTRVESLPDFVDIEADDASSAVRWREKVESNVKPTAKFPDTWGLYYQKDRCHYLNACLNQESLLKYMSSRLEDAGLKITPCAEGLRLQQRGSYVFAFNFGPDTLTLDHKGPFVIGGSVLEPAGVSVWTL